MRWYGLVVRIREENWKKHMNMNVDGKRARGRPTETLGGVSEE